MLSLYFFQFDTELLIFLFFRSVFFFLCGFFLGFLFCFVCNDWLTVGYFFFFFLFSFVSSQVQHTFPTICLYSDILCMCLQSKTSIHRLSRPKKSSATEGCETHPTARPKWWGKRRRFYSPPQAFKQGGSEGKSDAAGGREGGRRDGGMCAWEILQRLDGWDGGSLDRWGGGKLGVAEEGGKKLCERKREEKCPVRLWLFRMACCQLLMTELK